MKIAIGFITYNADTAKYLPYFLDSLFKSLEGFKKDDCLVLARDNSDEANNYNCEYIQDVFNKDEELIRFSWSGENAGFSKSYNAMIRESIDWGAELFLMINPDTVLTPDSVRIMVNVLTSDSLLGSVAPKVLSWDFINKELTNRIDTCGLKLEPGLVFTDIGQGLEDAGQFDNIPIIGPSGAAALFKTSALVKIKEGTGFLDERMFMYKEDCDLAYRLFLGGFSSKLVPTALVYHDRTVSAKGTGLFSALDNRTEKSQEVRSWSFLNQHLLIIKFWSKQNLVSKLHILLRIVLFGVYALFFEPFLLKNYSKISQYLKGAQTSQKAID
jgi:GT2 family glycosyltransferase